MRVRVSSRAGAVSGHGYMCVCLAHIRCAYVRKRACVGACFTRSQNATVGSMVGNGADGGVEEGSDQGLYVGRTL